MRDKKITRGLWHEFTHEELRERGMALSAAVAERRLVKEAQSESNKGFREKIDAIDQSIDALAAGIREQGEERLTACVVRFHAPTVGSKEIYREDTGEKLAQEAMTGEECQEHLFAQAEAEGATN